MKILSLIVFLFVVLLSVLVTGQALAVDIQTNIPGVTEAEGVGGSVAGFYKFALAISGVLAFGAIVYGGIQYTLAAGNPSGQSEGKKWVEGALIGLLLLLGAYIILNTINPDITTLAFPTLEKPGEISLGGGLVGVGGGLSNDQAFLLLNGAEIGVAAPSLEGIQQSTVYELIRLKNECPDCEMTVTSATTGSHASGECSHANGYKADLRVTDSLNDFITSNYTKQDKTRSDGAVLYQAPSGAIYADERNISGVAPHWDIAVQC